MKKFSISVLAGLTMVSFSACNSDNSAAKADVTNLSQYVDSVDNLKPVYTEANWTAINAGYEDKAAKADAISEKVDEVEKAKIAESKTKYATLKTRYEDGIKANDPAVIANKARMDIRNKLLGEGHGGSSVEWTYVTPGNVVTTYKNFVDRVRDNGANYSDAEWVETKALWSGLNDRKDAINKDISTLDKITIDHLKVAYLAVKGVNKPVSQLKEDNKK